jgi:hypothetical protein
MKTIPKNIKITPELNQWLEDQAVKRLTSVSAIIRELILGAMHTRGKVYECSGCGKSVKEEDLKCDPGDGCECHYSANEDEFDR